MTDTKLIKVSFFTYHGYYDYPYVTMLFMKTHPSGNWSSFYRSYMPQRHD